jgi:tetratricopeptide (TPR) repeat protein/transcriptional regulator with XRE-family HTH domain
MKAPLKYRPNLLLSGERLYRHWTQQELATRLGGSKINVSRWERGETQPSPYFRGKLSQVFGLPPEALGLTPAQGDAEGLGGPRPEEVGTALFDPAIPSPLLAAHLVGREAQLSELRAHLCAGVALALSGLPGVGKTTLAVALAHDPGVQAAFPGGILWAGLGPEPGLSGILSRWGTLLGVMPGGKEGDASREDWRAALRARLGARRMLIVLDDTWKIEDALALRIGGPGCGYLLSTRFPGLARRFAGQDGARRIGELGEEESLLLLTSLAPSVEGLEAPDAASLVRALGGLPLALSLVGHYLQVQARSGQPRRLREALHHLADTSARLRLSEPQAPFERSPSLPERVPLSLEAAIAVSDAHLGAGARAALYALSAFPPKPNSFSEDAALAVSAADADTLDQLVDAGLLERRGAAGRYALHQTIADYARLRRSSQVGEERLARFMADFVEAHAADFRALEQEYDTITAAILAAGEQGMSGALVRLVSGFTHYLEARGLSGQAESLLGQARAAALAAHDYAALAGVLLRLGRIAQRRGDYELAGAHFLEGRGYAQRAGDVGQLIPLLRNLGGLADSLGEYGQAESYFAEGLELARAAGEQGQAALMLNSLGIQTFRRGALDAAEAYWVEGLGMARAAGEIETECFILNGLANIAIGRKDYERGNTLLLRALELARQLGHLELVSGILANLGSIAVQRGLLQQAEKYLGEALEIARRVGHHWVTASTLLEVGDLRLRQQRQDEAEQAFLEVLRTLPEGSQELHALALYGLARVAEARGDAHEGRRLAEDSLARLESIGNAAAAGVRDWLSTLPPPPQAPGG